MGREMSEEAEEEKGARRNSPDIMGDDRVFLAWHRSHLANERTFLSWCRTSLGLIAFGFLMERMESFDLFREGPSAASSPAAGGSREMFYIALLAFALAAGAILVSGLRFLLVRRHINRGEAVFSTLPDILVIIAVIIVISFALALSIPKLEAIPWPF